MYMQGLCASVLRDSGQPLAAGASDASVAASVFAAGVAESCMDMSTIPDGMSPAWLALSLCAGHCRCTAQAGPGVACYIADLKSMHAHLMCMLAVRGDYSEDWHLIQRSAELQAAVADLEPDRRPPVLLAPLPSADASEAEQWARAMLTESGGANQLRTKILAAAERLRQMRRTL